VRIDNGHFRARPSIKAVLLLALATATACHKPEEDIGLDVLPDGSALGTVVMDTTRIVAWSRIPLAGKTSALSRNVTGSYLDPDFGLVTTGLVTQMLLSTSNVGFNDSTTGRVCDSLVLSLAYDATAYGYGNRDPQGFRVFRLAEELFPDSVYYNDDAPLSTPIDLVAGNRRAFAIEPFQGPVIGGDTLSPQLRIPLLQSLGQELLEHWGTAELQNNDNFVKYFKGLLVIPDAEASVPYQQAALYFNLLNPDSKLTLYYHTTTDTLSFDFIINTGSVRYTISHFDHDRALQPDLPLALADTAAGQQHIFLQALGGLRGELRFPGLENYAARGYGALAKAELIVPVEGTYYPLYTPPSQIFVFRKDEDGDDATIPDQVPTFNLVGGSYDAEEKAYRLVITQWVQGVINGTYPNTGLGMVSGSNGVSVNRVKLAGPEHAAERMRLRLTFTTY
jgi:Domain of unknown function (DUF4270)